MKWKGLDKILSRIQEKISCVLMHAVFIEHSYVLLFDQSICYKLKAHTVQLHQHFTAEADHLCA